MAPRMKQVYVSRAAEDLRILGERLDRLRAATERLGTDRKLLLEPALDDMRGMRNRAEAKLEDVRRTSDDAWPVFKVHADGAIESLRSAIHRFEEGMICTA